MCIPSRQVYALDRTEARTSSVERGAAAQGRSASQPAGKPFVRFSRVARADGEKEKWA
jgi:hypothetical protein